MTLLLSPRIRAASIVPRWSIVWAIERDNVAVHSFFVSVYCIAIADLIGWKGDRGELLSKVILHDFDEIVTGDIVAPVKSKVVNKPSMLEFVHDWMARNIPWVNRYLNKETPEEHAILKAADTLDALLFALTEHALGNRIIGARVESCWHKAVEAWYCLPADKNELQRAWRDQIVPSILAHSDPDQFDIRGNT